MAWRMRQSTDIVDLDVLASLRCEDIRHVAVLVVFPTAEATAYALDNS